MMETKYGSLNIILVINKHSYNKEQILAIDTKTISKLYQRDVFHFLQEWWNDEDFVTATTSGSTGKPKTIKLNKKKMMTSAQATGTFFGFRPKDVVCSPLPAKYIAGKMMLVRAMLWDLEIHIFKPSQNPLADIVNEYSFMVMTPHQLSYGLSCNNEKNLDLVQQLLLGGSPVNQSLENKVKTLKTNIYLGYGMTETMSHVALRKLNGTKKSDHYQAVDGTTFSLDNRECLIIHSPKLLHKELVTNDIVSLVDHKNFSWKGRYDHVINTGGIKVFPEEIEKKIAHLFNTNFYVSSTIHEDLGSQVVLYIEGIEFNESKIIDLRKRLNTFLTTYEMPKEFIFRKNFEYTENGKVIRV